MRNFVKFIAIAVLSTAVGVGMLFGAMALEWSGNACIVSMFVGCIVTALTLGVCDIKERTRYDSIRHRMGIKNAA